MHVELCKSSLGNERLVLQAQDETGLHACEHRHQTKQVFVQPIRGRLGHVWLPASCCWGMEHPQGADGEYLSIGGHVLRWSKGGGGHGGGHLRVSRA